jgi:hypothetical protein
VSDPLTDAPKKAKVTKSYPNTTHTNLDEAFCAGASEDINDDLNDSALKASAFNIGTPDEVSDVENVSDKENVEPSVSRIRKFKLKTPAEFRAHYMAGRKRRFEATVDKIANNL